MKSSLRRLVNTLVSLMVTLTMLVPGIQPQPVSAQEPTGGLQRGYNAESGKVSLISGVDHQPLAVLGPRAAGMIPEAQSLALVQRFAPEFGLTSPSEELRLSEIDQPSAGRVVSKYQQMHQGVPVMASELIVNASKAGALLSMNGEVSPGLTLDTNPKLTVETAIEIAKQGMVKWYGGDAKDYTASVQPALWIFDESLLKPSTRPAALVWRLEITSIQQAAPIRELVLVDAKTGNVSLHFNQVDTAWGEYETNKVNPSQGKQTKNASNKPSLNTEIPAATGTTWYVSTTGNDVNDCLSPSTPCATINGAIGKAVDGDVIYVGNGRYTKQINDNWSVFISIYKSLTLIGGWNSTFSAQNGLTIIDGENKYSGVSNVAANTILSNFVVTKSMNGVNNDLRGSLTLDQVAVINNVRGVSNMGESSYYKATMIIKNSTISGNEGPGISNGDGDLSIFNSTITDNVSTELTAYGGGIRNMSGTITITNSIVANNSAPQTPDCYNYEYGGGFLISGGYNILGSTAGCTITSAVGDKFNVDPLLSPLLPSGYHAIAEASPAVNAGNPLTCLQKDQRGADRLADANCDIGAYEYTVPGTATNLLAVNPETKRAPVNSPFLSLLKVVALDANGNPVGGVNISFSAPKAEPLGRFSDTNSNNTSATTDSNGLATSPTFIAGGQTGNFVVNATAPNISSIATFNFHNGTWLVSPTGSNSNDCLDVNTPCASVFGVLEKPEFIPGETIWLSIGVYPWPGTTADAINKDVYIEGGWSPTFDSIQGVSEINPGWFLVSYPNLANVKVSRIDFNGASIKNNGNLIIENSSVRNSELGITNSGYGNLTLNNVTVSENGPFYTAIRNQGTLTLLNATLTGNRGYFVGGIENESPGKVYLKNSIIAGNTSTSPVDFASVDCQGAFVSLGNNIIGTIGSLSYTGFYDCYGSWSSIDILGDDTAPIPIPKILLPAIQRDIVSGQLVHPLMLGSIAIDSGSSCPLTDQRGVSRPQGGACDIGAYEYVFESSLSSALIRTYNAGNTTILPGIRTCDETDWSCPAGDAEARNAHNFAKGLYDLYLAKHNRISLDGKGIEILSAVNYGAGYQNAYWNGHMVIFGDGYPNADDVVAHELTHGVTDYESNLFYFYQSGAINESFSDVWGEYYDQTNGLGTDTPAVNWLMGEDVSGSTPIRSMSNPPTYGDPDKMSSANYDKTDLDNGGVHTNSGVNNKAVFLMVDGGSFNGKTVSALGWDKTAAIYYEAQTNLLSSGADYSDLYFALQQACVNLTGQLGINAANCTQLKNALDAVEMNSQPAANFNPDAPVCAAGLYANPLFKDNLESGSAKWAMTGYWSHNSGYASSGTRMLYGDDYYVSTESSAAMANGVALPVSNSMYLYFKHAFAFEYYLANYYDGGVLEYTVNDGANWTDASPLFVDGQNYKGTISNYAGTTNSLKGRNGFVADSHGYVSSRYNLSSLGGQTVKFRWRFATDNMYSYLGWMVDDVQIYTCKNTPPFPYVVSSLRAGTDPTSLNTVTFNVTFSENVTGVDASDFSLTTSGVSGAAVSGVNGSGSVYTVAVSTGSGSGTIRLDVADNDSILSAFSAPLGGAGGGNGNFNTGEAYTISKEPLITAFSAASHVNTLAIPITTFSAWDTDLAGYMITTSAVRPLPAAAGWSISPPATFTVPSAGSYTLYPWAKDSFGNVSSAYGSPLTVVVDLTNPAAASITRLDPSPNGLSIINFTVTFSEPVTGVDVTDFTLTSSGVSGPAVSGVSGSGSVYTVAVSTGSGSGTIRMDLTDNNSIMDAASNPLGGAAAGDGNFTGGETYTVTRTWIFGDTPNTYWANSFIERLYNAGITGGCSTIPLYYCPDNTVTRAQMAVFLLRGIHGAGYQPPAVNGVTNFTDVPTNYWAAPWIKQLAVEGITAGCGAGNYCPEDNVSRAQMAVFLLRAKHGATYQPPAATGIFTDVPVGYWARNWIERLAVEAITSGCGAGTYCPDNSVTRAEMAVFLVRTFNLP